MSRYDDIALTFFLEEADEHFTALEEGLLRLEDDPQGGTQIVESLFRSAHTLKGSAGLAKLSELSAVAHCLEDALESMRDEKRQSSAAVIDAMLFALDRMKDMARRTVADEPIPAGTRELVEKRLDAAFDTKGVSRQETPSATSPPQAPLREDPQPEPAAESDLQTAPSTRTIRVDAGKIEKMMNVLGELTVTKTHLLNQLQLMETLREEVAFSGERLVKEVGRFSERYLYALPAQTKSEDHLLADFDDLEFDRYDEVNLFARKLQEISNDINEALRAASEFFTRFSTNMESVDRMTGEMKERLSEIRTIRAGALFQRFARSVRELSRQSGRKIELKTSGGETPIDRTIYDALFAPLLHIIRNAVAHGFEGEEERVRLGKSPVGTINLAAIRRGNSVEITVSDDGRGIQFELIRERAIRQGLLDADAHPQENELLNLIYQPGFSTASSADSTSGRGVGMNVVMDRLSAINGTIDIHTCAGEGTTVRLTLPLSLVIINVVQFRLGTQDFVIPSTLVSEIVDLPGDEKAAEELALRGRRMPMVDLSNLLSLGRGGTGGAGRIAIVTQASGVDVAMVVDEIVSQEDTVIKPFGRLLHNLPLFSGSSISGDGRLRLVVNPARLLSTGKSVAPQEPPPQTTEADEKVTVLVVDDSLSVRRYAGMMLENGGFNVLTASNGLEALEVLEREQVHFIFSDLEMPLMHGYELLNEMRRRGLLAITPVAILSSRTGDSHVNKARELGACDYVAKPFEEETLLQIVHQHIS